MKKLVLSFSLLLVAFLVGCTKTPTLNVQDLELKVGEEKNLVILVENSDKKVSFEVTDDTVATISSTGVVKGLKEGTTTFKASLEDTDLSVTATITVKPADLVVTLDITGPSTLSVGQVSKVNVTSNDPLGVTYTSSDSTVITVDGNGNLEAVKAGSAVITVQSKSDTTISQTLTIKAEDIISIEADDFVLFVDEVKALLVIHNDALGVSVTSSNETVISVDGLNVTALTSGTATLTITSLSDAGVSIEVEVTVLEKPYVNVVDLEKVMSENDEFTLEFDASHTAIITISDESILSIEAGIVKALKEGTATITVSLEDYPLIKQDITVTVYPKITLEIQTDIKIKIQETLDIPITSTHELVFTSSDSLLLTVEGDQMTGVKGGTPKIIVTSEANPTFSQEVEVFVLGMPTRLTLSAQTDLVLAETTQIVSNFTPVNTFSYVTYASSNSAVVTVSEEGIVTAVGLGTAVVTVTSTIDARLKASISFKVEQINAVKLDLTDGETIQANGYSFTEGINAFRTLDEALAGSPREVILVGEYDAPLLINQTVIISGTPETRIKNVLTVASDLITIKGLTFTGEGRLLINPALQNIVITKNTFETLTYTTAAIHAEETKQLEVSYNNMNLNGGIGVEVINPIEKVVLIKGNIINNASTAIRVQAVQSYLASLAVQVMWNKIDLVETGFDIDLMYQETIDHASSYVRFNEVSNYSFGAKAALVNHVDFNLNYWGGVPSMSKFENLDEFDLEGFYMNNTDVLPESLYTPGGPAFLKILNNLTEVNINEVIKVEYKVLPKDTPTSSVQVLTGDSTIMTVDSTNTIRFKKSGYIDLIVRSKYNSQVEDKITFEVITDPGIELIPESVNNHITVGKTLQFSTVVFPKRIEAEAITFSVDNPTIASIDSTGLLSAISPGLVTIKAQLTSDETVYQTFKLEIYDELDPTNIMDFISSSMVTYTTPRSFLLYGESNVLYQGYDSVSRIIFEELDINRSKMIPDCDSLTGSQRDNCRKLRPGERPALIEGLEAFNNKNVYYITVHETGSTNPDAGALSHANYLMNQVIGTTTLRQASWHFTMDDKEVYQHIETDEMAWHAGDGSRKAGTTWSDTWGNENIGGGNTHSIGIETSVARNHDILRVWQRTAKLSSQLAKQYNLPEENVKFHEDFSSKICPQSMIRGNLTGLFYEMLSYEYKLVHDFSGAQIEFTSHNPEYVDNAGRVIKRPDRAQNVSFTIKVTYNGETVQKTYYSYLPGTVH
jgi:N-acetylmuramoyl-L-alanine amidase